MGVSWSKEQQAIAKAECKCLVAVAIDGRPANMTGKIEFTAPVSRATAEDVWALLNRLLAMKPKDR